MKEKHDHHARSRRRRGRAGPRRIARAVFVVVVFFFFCAFVPSSLVIQRKAQNARYFSIIIIINNIVFVLPGGRGVGIDLVHRGDSDYDDMKCVSEEHNERAIVLFSFKSIDNVKLSIKVFDPNDKVVKQFEDVAEGDQLYAEVGDYKACFLRHK